MHYRRANAQDLCKCYTIFVKHVAGVEVDFADGSLKDSHASHGAERLSESEMSDKKLNQINY